MFKQIQYFDPDQLHIGQAIEIFASEQAAKDLFNGQTYIHAVLIAVTEEEICVKAYVSTKAPMSMPQYQFVDRKIHIEAIRDNKISMRACAWNDDEDLYPDRYDEDDDDEDDDDEEFISPVRPRKKRR